MNVLVAEDSEMMRHVLVTSLKKWDYEVQVAEDGQQAWDLFQSSPVPLVLTDWIMPHSDGLELVKRIRASDQEGYTYIIVLTSKTENEALVDAMDAGADDFLFKPYHPEELRVRVREGERIIALERSLADKNRRLQETQAALVQSEYLASIGKLAAGMAHEINNPISIVTNNMTVLKRDIESVVDLLKTYQSCREALAEHRPDLVEVIDDKTRECDWQWLEESLPRLFSGAQSGLSRVREIILNLRNFARLDEAEQDDLDLHQAIRSTLDIIRSELDEKQISVTLDLASSLPVVSCRPAKINQVIYHLLVNAAQACQTGGSITVHTADEDDAAVRFQVEDDGCGISPQQLSRVFDPFFTTRPVGAGSGLGLTTSYAIVRDHGGIIDVSSEVDQGSKFTVRLPREQAEQLPVAKNGENAAHEA